MASARQYLILAEGLSGDPHYGKTMRGVVRVRRRPDRRDPRLWARGRVVRGDPDRRHGRRCARLRADNSARRRGDAGWSLPACVASAARRSALAPASTSRTVCTSICRPMRSWSPSRRVHGVELRDLRKPPAGLNVPTGANLDLDARIVLTVGSDCAIGKMTVALELDREARRRGLTSRLRADGPDGDRDRRLGDLGGRGRLRLHRRRGRAAGRRGQSSAAARSSGWKGRARCCTRPIRASPLA